MDEPEALVTTAASEGLPTGERLAAFGELVRRFQDMAYGCAYAVLGDFHLAEDAAQEAFVAAYRDLARLREPRAFASWLRQLVLAQCRRLTRRKRVRTVGLDAASGVASAETPPHEALAGQEMKDRVLAAVRSLPEHQRMVTTLFYINGYSQNEIAEFLGVPLTTVKKRPHDSRHRLKERMMHMVDETLKSFALPADFADVVVRRAASQQELEQAAGLIAYQARTHPQDFASRENADRAGIYVIGPAGRVEAAGYFGTFEMGIGSTVLTCLRPSEMGAEARGVPDPAFVKGFLGCFKIARERGIHLAAVHGSQYDHAFCGFVPSFYYAVATLPCERVAGVTTRATLAEATPRQAEDACRAWLLDPYAPKMAAYVGGGTPHVVEQDGEIVGYVNVNRDFRPETHCNMPIGHVTDVTVRTREAALAVLRLAGELTRKAGGDTIYMLQSHMTLITQAILSLGGTYRLRGSCDLVGLDAEMLAILDLPGLTEELAGEFGARFAASPARDADASFSIEIGGATVGFSVKAGRLRIVRRKQRVHRLLPRWVLTRLYVGYYSGADVLAMGPRRSPARGTACDRRDGQRPDDPDLDLKPLLLPEPEAALFCALFPKLWPVSWPDPDVWPWVIGKPGPRYQGEKHKTPEMKARIDALRFPWLGF